MSGFENRNPSAPAERPVTITTARRAPRSSSMPPPSAAPRASSAPKAPSNRALFRLGATQMVLTIVVVIVLNVVARRLGLNFWGSVALCAVVALAWPFVAARFRRR